MGKNLEERSDGIARGLSLVANGISDAAGHAMDRINNVTQGWSAADRLDLNERIAFMLFENKNCPPCMERLLVELAGKIGPGTREAKPRDTVLWKTTPAVPWMKGKPDGTKELKNDRIKRGIPLYDDEVHDESLDFILASAIGASPPVRWLAGVLGSFLGKVFGKIFKGRFPAKPVTTPSAGASVARTATMSNLEGLPGRAATAEDLASLTTSAKGNQLAIGSDTSTNAIFNGLNPQAGYFDVIIHGSSDGFYVVIAGERVNLTVEQVAQLIKSQPGYTGQPIRLMSCWTAMQGVAGPAQALANALGGIVIAPVQRVGVTPNGQPQHYTPYTAANGKVSNMTIPDGKFETFNCER